MSLATLQIKTNWTGGNYATLEDFISRRKVKATPYQGGQEVTTSAAAFALIDSSVLAGTLAIGTDTTQEQGAVVAAQLAGAVGTAATTKIQDAIGNVLNLVDIRETESNDPITDTDGRRVYGLIQAASTATDGDAIGAAASENLQISFVKYDASDTLVTVALTGDIEFVVNKIYSDKYLPILFMEGGATPVDVVVKDSSQKERVYTIATDNAPAGLEINLDTDALAENGTSTVTIDADMSSTLGTAPLPASGATFANNPGIQIYRNGVKLLKGATETTGDVGWKSTAVLQLNVPLYVGETIHVVVPSVL
jgi:hypothetical protein